MTQQIWEPYDRDSPEAKRAQKLLLEAESLVDKAGNLIAEAGVALIRNAEKYRILSLGIDTGKLSYGIWYENWRLKDGTMEDDAPGGRADQGA